MPSTPSRSSHSQAQPPSREWMQRARRSRLLKSVQGWFTTELAKEIGKEFFVTDLWQVAESASHLGEANRTSCDHGRSSSQWSHFLQNCIWWYSYKWCCSFTVYHFGRRYWKENEPVPTTWGHGILHMAAGETLGFRNLSSPLRPRRSKNWIHFSGRLHYGFLQVEPSDRYKVIRVCLMFARVHDAVVLFLLHSIHLFVCCTQIKWQFDDALC